MALPVPKTASEHSPSLEREVPTAIAADAAPNGTLVSPVAIIHEQLSARLNGPEERWAPRTALWLSAGAAGAMWIAIVAVARAVL